MQIKTLFRFKGQAADAIVITEMDFVENLDDQTRKKLFVALTRARLAVSFVISESCSECLSKILGYDFNHIR